MSRPLLEQTHKPSYSVLGAVTRDQPLRKSAWEATIVSATPRNNSLAVRKTVAEPLLWRMPSQMSPFAVPVWQPYSLNTSVKNETTLLTVSGNDLLRNTKCKASAEINRLKLIYCPLSMTA